MTQDQALIPKLISSTQIDNKMILNIASIITGVILLSLLAQIAIPLPWTPVPITGQTFGVALISLMWGRKRGIGVMLTYLFIGAAGAPIFAMGKSGFSIGPTSGYLIGMACASYWMGYLADIGLTKNFIRTWLVAVSGSLITFTFGLGVLAFFIPIKNLLISGLIPFLPGDLIKTFISSFIAYQIQTQTKDKL